MQTLDSQNVYATNVTLDRNTNSSTVTDTSSSTRDFTNNGTENYVKTIIGNNGRKYNVDVFNDLVSKLKNISNIKLYNETSNSGILAFNIDGVFAQDSSIYLNNYNIYVRAGNHCTKMLKDEIGVKNTIDNRYPDIIWFK